MASQAAFAYQWSKAFKEKKFTILFFPSLSLLVVCGLLAPYIFNYIEGRNGWVLNDPFLEIVPAYNLSSGIFFILYLLIGTTVVYLIFYPHQLLFALQAYTLLTIFRFITLLLIPLEQPPGLILLQDPVVDRFFYQQPVTKDLFFSGHTSILFLFGLIVRHAFLRGVLFLGAAAVGTMVLIQHAHYTVDVIAAPFFAWLACRSIRRFNLRDQRL